MDKYYIIKNPDGDTTVEELTKKEILKELQLDGELSSGHLEFKESIGVERDTNFWGEDGVLIIKGKIVVPTNKKIIVEREIE